LALPLVQPCHGDTVTARVTVPGPVTVTVTPHLTGTVAGYRST